MIWDGFNNRKFPRVHIQCDIVVHPETNPSSPISATTENVGIGGVCVMLDRELDRFSSCKVRLDLGPEENSLECSGRVVWKVGTKNLQSKHPYFDTGIEFVNLEKEKKEKIRQFIENKTK